MSDLITHDALIQAVNYYSLIRHPNKLRETKHPNGFEFIDEEQVLAKIMQIYPISRMYGSSREFAENLRIWRNFTGNWQAFGNDICEPYNHTMTIRKSHSGGEYICKQDVLLHLQNLIIRNNFHHGQEIALAISVMLLKMHEGKKIKEVEEFVKWDDEALLEMYKEFEEDLKTPLNLRIPITMGYFGSGFFTPQTTEQELFNQLREVFDISDYIPSDLFMKFIKEKLAEEFKKCKRVKEYATNVFVVSISIVTAIQECFKNYPWFFESRFPVTIGTRSTPPTLRVFEDGTDAFVMDAELNLVLFGKQTNKNAKYCKTTSLEQVQKEHKLAGIELISYPLTKTAHHGTMILAPNGRYCIPAGEHFLHCLRAEFFDQQLIRKSPGKKWRSVETYFVHLKKYYDPEKKHRYFIFADRNYLAEWIALDVLQTVSLMPRIDVREVSTSGFTLNDLHNELEYLYFDAMFPDVKEYTEQVYKWVDERKKEEKLRTVDMYDALEQCYLICLSKKFSWILDFLHNQKICHRFLHNCELTPIPTPQKPENSENHEKSQKEMEEKVNELERKYKSIELENGKLKKSLKNEQNEMKELKEYWKSQLAKMAATREKMLEEHAERVKTLTVERLANKSLTEKLNEAERKYKSIELENGKMKKSLENKEKEMEKMKGDWKSQLAKMSAQKEKLLDRNAQKEKEVFVEKESNKLLTEELNSLKMKMMSLEESENSEKLEEKVRELENENFQLKVLNEEKEKMVQKLMDRLAKS